MKIELNDAEIKNAIEAYVATQGVSTHGKEVTVSLRAGRGDNGFTAEVELEASAVPPVVNVRSLGADTKDVLIADEGDDQESPEKEDDGEKSDPSNDDSLFK